MKNSLLSFILIVLVTTASFAQVAINETGETPSSSAILDLSSNNKGLLIPRMTTNNRTTNVTAVAGLLVFDTDTDSFWYYDGTQSIWIEVKAGSALDINSLADGSSDGTSVFLGNNAGSADDGINYNTALGIRALAANTSGEQNVAIGNAALANNTVRSDLVAIGDSALFTTNATGNIFYGSRNIAIGASALFSNTNGYRNTAIGYNTMYSNTTGGINTAVGEYALYSNTTGTSNTALGYNTLYLNIEGDDNTAIGKNALFNNTSGDKNTAVGVYALLSHKTNSSNVALGYEALRSDTSGMSNTAIGTYSMQHNKSGNYNTAIGLSSLYRNTTGDKNTAIGKGALSQNTTASSNTAIGYNALYYDTTGHSNTANGYLSLQANISGSYNTASGDFSLYWNTTGNYNVASGSSAMESNTTGNSNVAIGVRSLYSNSVCSNLVAIGDSALYNNGTGASGDYEATGNTAIGSKSSFANTSGYENTSVGNKSSYSNTTGNSNVSFGGHAMEYNTTGSNNTVVGKSAGQGASGNGIYNGCVLIGYESGKNNTDDNKLFIDNSSTSSPLIGGDFTANRVDINGTIKITGGTPGSGKVLTSNANGVASWGAAGASEIDDLSDARIFNSSLFLGEDAGSGLGGHYNTGIGLGALQAITYGNNSTAIGYNALNANTFGGSNVAIGEECLFENVGGDNNVAIGSLSGKQGEDGDYNVLIGYASGYKGPSSASVIIGNQAGYNTTSYQNVFLGFKAGYNNTTGHSNVFLGNLAGFNETGSEKLYIDNSATSTPLIGGDFSTNQVDINGTIKITGGTPGSGKVLTSDTDGDATWETPTTYASSINDLSDAIYDGSSLFFGVGSGMSDDGYNANTSIGHYSLPNNTSGIYNTSVGYQSLRANITGSWNSAFGYESLEDNVGGQKNTSVGFNSLNNNTSGDNNVGMGYNALLYNTTGNNNTAIGMEAGLGIYGDNVTGCVFLGYNAGKNNTSDNKLFIDNSSTTSPLIGGDFNTNQVDINGTIKITGGTPGNGKVLTSDADGDASWETPTTYASSINDLSDAIYDGMSIFLGVGSGVNDDGYNSNTSIGHYSLSNNTSGIYNTVTGYQALRANTTGSNNSAFGLESLESNIAGNSNSAYGFQSLNLNTSGNDNVGMGYNVLFYNSTGSSNTAIGVMAGQGVSGNNFSGCVFLGYNAGLNNTSNNQLFIDNSGTSTPLIGGNFSSNQVNINGTIKITGGTPGSGKVLTSDADGLATWETPTVYASAINDLSDASSVGTKMFLGTNAGINNTGSYNTGVGYESLKLNSSGTYNTAFGFKTLDANTEGIGNTGLGHGSLGANTTGDYNTAIGREALDANTTGNYNTAVGFNAFPSGTFSNSVAIGYNTSISGNNQIHLGNTSITEIKGQVAFTTYSDGRIKENIKEDVSGLDFILKLRPVTYNINLDKENQLLGIDNQTDFSGKYDIEKVKRSGFIAQEVEVAAKTTNYDFSGVQKPKNEKDLYGLAYAEFVVPLVKGMQEQQQQIRTLKTENTELKARLDRLEKLINQR